LEKLFVADMLSAAGNPSNSVDRFGSSGAGEWEYQPNKGLAVA
jgi:hypothetical protein